MIIEIDLKTVPPAMTLIDVDDFTAFKVVVRDREHVYVAPEQIARLAGDRGGDADWRAGLATMIAFAKEHGFAGDDGSIRAHVEHV